MDDLLPREMWASCLEFATSTKFKASTDYRSDYDDGQKEYFLRVKDAGPLPLRATCTLFSTLCVEIITNIDVVNEYGNEYEVNFLIKPLTHVLLARPRSLKSIDFDLDELNEVDRVFGEDWSRQLSFALEVEEIVLVIKLVVPGSLLRDIGERCT